MAESATVMTMKQSKARRRETLRPHPLREQIVDIMRSCDRPMSPAQLSRITGATLGSVAYHVRTLVAAGIVELNREGRARGAVEHFYALAPGQDEVALTDPTRALLSACGLLTLPGDKDELPRPVRLDDEARAELNQLIAKLRPRVEDIAAASTSRVVGETATS